MAHEKQNQSTGAWKGNRDKHEGQQKGANEKKKQKPEWRGNPSPKKK
jgi:hypothetical protein